MNLKQNKKSNFPFTPVVIIGAGRSGTNALRDSLTALDGFETWPCDEINAIWRHRNTSLPDDQFTSQHAHPAVKVFIRRAFLNLWKASGQPAYVVEKTCANSLRVDFVHAVLPEAKFIHIVRDGGDVTASAVKRWRGELEFPGLPYFIAKLRYLPPSDLPKYAIAFIRNRFSLVLGEKKQLSAWGPRFKDIGKYADAPLEEICARQWAACVQKSAGSLRSISGDRTISLRYEDFTANPAETIATILTFLNASAPPDDLKAAVAPIKKSSVGKGATVLENLRPEVRELVDTCMKAEVHPLSRSKSAN